MHTSFNLLIKF